MSPASRSIEQAVTVARMVEYGITRVPVDSFHLGEWRYANLDDAIAQARRIAPVPSKSR